MLLFKTCLFTIPRKKGQHYKNNNCKIIAPVWGNEFVLSDGYYSVSDYVEYIIKKYETLPLILLPTYIYINRINQRLVLKVKDRYKLDLQTPESVKLFDNTEKLTDKTNL